MTRPVGFHYSGISFTIDATVILLPYPIPSSTQCFPKLFDSPIQIAFPNTTIYISHHEVMYNGLLPQVNMCLELRIPLLPILAVSYLELSLAVHPMKPPYVVVLHIRKSNIVMTDNFLVMNTIEPNISTSNYTFFAAWNTKAVKVAFWDIFYQDHSKTAQLMSELRIKNILQTHYTEL